MATIKGKWEHLWGNPEVVRGECSVCKRCSELKTEVYYLSTEVTGLDKCPHCGIEMEPFFKIFE